MYRKDKVMKICSKPVLIAYVCFAIVVSAMSTGFAFVLSTLIDLIAKNDIGLLIKAIIFSCLYTGISVVFGHLLGLWKNQIIKKHMKDLKVKLFESYLKMSHQDFQKESIGGALNQLTSNASQYQRLYLESMLGLPTTLISLVIAIAATLYIDYRLLLIMVGFGILMMLLTKYTSNQMNRDTAQMMQCNESNMRLFKDQLSGHFLIRSSNLMAHATHQIEVSTESALKASTKQSNTMLFMTNASMFLGLLSTVIIMGISAIFAVNQIISIGMVLALSQLMGKIISPISQMGQIVNHYKSGKLIKLSFDQYTQPSIEPQKAVKLSSIDKIEVKNLNFSYENLIFKDFSYTFQMNKKYAIVGPVGCGKSTLLKLLGGMINSADIYYNDLAQRDVEKESLYRHIAFVPQTPYFFEDSIYNNLTLYGNIPLEEVEKVIESVGLRERITCLSDGLNTMLTENAQLLSGGERQKLALARAILSDKPILLLDEYTSSMDPQSSLLVQKSVSTLNKTVIFITHKVNDYDVLHADEVIELG